MYFFDFNEMNLQHNNHNFVRKRVAFPAWLAVIRMRQNHLNSLRPERTTIISKQMLNIRQISQFEQYCNFTLIML